MRAALLALVAGLAPLSDGTRADEPPKALDKATLAEVRKLQEERRKLLTEALAVREKLYQGGRAELDGALETSKRLLAVESDLAATRAEIIAAHERHLKTALALVEVAKAKHESGRGTHASVLDAKGSALEAQIGLLKAGGKKKRPPDVVVNEKDREAKAAVGQTIAVRVPEPALGLRVVDLKAEVEGEAVGRTYEVGDTVDREKKEALFDGLFKTLTLKAEKPGTSKVTITYERGDKKVERVITIRVTESRPKG
jgi:hypothetical protein